MDILYVKALHIIFVVSWFAGLLYIVRLFIYHVESEVKPAPEKKALQQQFKIMERKLWYIITWPAAILASFFGYWLVIELNYWAMPWMQVKLVLIALLWIYHLVTHWLFVRNQQDDFRWNSLHLRLWNELATLWLVAIVFTVVLKDSLHWIYGTVGFIVVAAALFLGVRLYRKLKS